MSKKIISDILDKYEGAIACRDDLILMIEETIQQAKREKAEEIYNDLMPHLKKVMFDWEIEKSKRKHLKGE